MQTCGLGSFLPLLAMFTYDLSFCFQANTVQVSLVRYASGSSPANHFEQKPTRISPNLSFRTARNGKFDDHKKPLVLLYGWLLAKAQHIYKYGDFYLDKGFDVLHVKVNLTNS